jgi:O-antigen/teichoic acid export membrane protein
MPSVRAASQLLSFGAWVATDRFLWTLYRTADSLIVARLFGPVTLGFYATGQNLASIARRRMAPLFTTVSYPVLSRMIDEPERFARYVLGLSRAASLFAFPLCAGLSLTAADFVPLFFTEKWLGAILPIQVLALVAAVQLQGNLLVPAIQALGRPAWNTALTAATALVLPAALWGAATLTNEVGGVLAVVAAVYPLLLAARVCILRTLAGLRVSGYLVALAPAGLSSLVMMALVAGAQVWLQSAPAVVRLSTSVVVGVCSYGFMLWVAFPGVFRQARGVVRELRA